MSQAATTTMEMHALGILEAAESWDWPSTARTQATGVSGGKFKAITLKLLSGFISKSQELGGTLLDQFWVVVAKCHSRLGENIRSLQCTAFSSSGHSETVLFEGVDREAVNFQPVYYMAAELFTHLGIAFMNPGRRKSGTGTPFSVSDEIPTDTDELLQIAAAEGFGTKKQAAIKALVLKRDGLSCSLTGALFTGDDSVIPILAHVIPNSVHGKPDTMKCIAMFAGTAVRDLVLQRLNDLSNFMTIQSDAQTAYDDLRWGIEGRTKNETVEYIYRRIPLTTSKGPGYIHFLDGDQIVFGGGPEAARLGLGPHPLLCNLQLAVARVLKMSGAAEVIAQIIEDSDDSDFPHVYIASPDFCSILSSQLLLSGRVVVEKL